MSDINDSLDKVLHFGIGLFAYSKEKVQDLVDDMVARGEVQKENASKVVDDLVERGKKERVVVEDYLDEKLRKKDFATKDDIRKIIREELDHFANGEAASVMDEESEELDETIIADTFGPTDEK